MVTLAPGLLHWQSREETRGKKFSGQGTKGRIIRVKFVISFGQLFSPIKRGNDWGGKSLTPKDRTENSPSGGRRGRTGPLEKKKKENPARVVTGKGFSLRKRGHE